MHLVFWSLRLLTTVDIYKSIPIHKSISTSTAIQKSIDYYYNAMQESIYGQLLAVRICWTLVQSINQLTSYKYSNPRIYSHLLESMNWLTAIVVHEYIDTTIAIHEAWLITTIYNPLKTLTTIGIGPRIYQQLLPSKHLLTTIAIYKYESVV